MANIRNIDAESGANFIGDDALPTLRMENSSTGPGLSVDDVIVTSIATISSTATLGRPITIGRTVSGAASVALMGVHVSGASTPVLELLGSSFTSAVSLIFAAGANWAGMGAIRVKLSDGVTYGWIPVLPPGQVTAAAVA